MALILVQIAHKRATIWFRVLTVGLSTKQPCAPYSFKKDIVLVVMPVDMLTLQNNCLRLKPKIPNIKRQFVKVGKPMELVNGVIIAFTPMVKRIFGN